MAYISNAKITIYKYVENTWEKVDEGYTDEYGHYEKLLPYGTYKIVIEKEGYATVTKYISLTRDSFLTVNLPSALPSAFVYSLSPKIGVGFSLTAKPSLPSPAVTSGFSASASLIHFANVLRLPLQIPLLSIISNPSRPIPQSFISLVLSSTIMRNMQTPKPSTSFSIISNPSRPIPQSYTSFSASVGVRKSP